VEGRAPNHGVWGGEVGKEAGEVRRRGMRFEVEQHDYDKIKVYRADDRP